MSGQQKLYITTAISYPNGSPHLGHAYEAIATDAIARFERLDGKDVYFLTGTDEHGLKMKQTAQKEGLTPRALADRNSQRFRELAESVHEAFFVMEPGTGRALYVNPAYEEVFGHSREHAYHTPYAWTEAIHPPVSRLLGP